MSEEENKMPMPGLDGHSKQGEGSESFEEEKPVEYNTPDENNKSEINLPPSPKKGIKVRAIRDGFYAQQRRKAGDEFPVKSFEKLGEWMQCLDPQDEKKRKEILKKKKQKKKKASN